MLSIILAALPILAKLIPDGKTADIVAAGTKVALDVFGTTDEASIVAKMEADPALAEQFKAKLTAETEALRMSIEDTQDARALQVKMVEGGSFSQYAPAILTAINFCGFYGILILILIKGLPDTGARELVSGMVGAVVGSYLASNNYFFGTSASSARSGEALRSIATSSSSPSAGQIAGKAIDAAVKSASKR
jgi:hypothetical protein